MTNEQICEELNAILANELAGAMMYLHYSFFIHGHARIPIVGWLRSQSNEGMTHATLVGDKIMALGGTPVTAASAGKFPPRFSSLNEMLASTLRLEKEVFAQYTGLLGRLHEDQITMRMFLESMITEEIGHIEEIEKMLLPEA